MGPVSMIAIVEKTLEGIVRAQDDYETWTGGSWLWKAPEYLVTSYIAREISTIEENACYVTLESNVKNAIRYSGGRSGRPRSALRHRGKFDILLWWRSNHARPRAVIEVKKHVSGFAAIKDDVARICAVLSRPKSKTSFQCGLVAFYTSKYLEDRPKEVKPWLNSRLERISPEKSPIFVARAPSCRGSGPHGPQDAEGVVDTTSKRLEGVRPATAATLGARSDRLASAAGNR